MRLVPVFVGLLLVAAGCGGSSPAATGTGGGGGNAAAGTTGGGGAAGSAGVTGAAGAAGATGAGGVMGAGGAAGAVGTAGAAGTAGGAGTAGAGGSAGTAGTAGAAGGSGNTGAAGTTAGAAGAAGVAGAAGAAGAGGAAGTAGSGGGAGGATSYYIVGDIDGVTDRAEMNPVAYKYQGTATAELRVDASSTMWNWTVVVNNPTVGCGINLVRRGNFTAYTSALTGGSCTHTVTPAAPNVGDVLEGTFSGTVVIFTGATGTPPMTITNGRFRVPRIADQPLP